MREIFITEECLEFIDNQTNRVELKFYQLIEILRELPLVHKNFEKKITNTDFYELRIKAGNEVRVIMFAVDNDNFQLCTKVILLNGFVKKSTKDYKRALTSAEKILLKYK